MPERVHCRVLRHTAELEGFEPQWNLLWHADPDATPFQRPEWLLPWWHQFGQPDLRALVLTRGAATIGFLPFYVYREPRSGERQMLLVGVGTTDYLDGIFAPQCAVEDVAHALQLLCAEPGWDALTVTQLRPESRLHRALLQMNGARPFASYACSRMPALRMAELPQKIRRNVMYYRNRALRQGELELAIAGEPGSGLSCEEALEALRRLHTERWQQRNESGVLADQRVLAWHREAVPRLQRRGMLRLCCLRLNGTIIGVLYSLVDPPDHAGRTQYFYLTAYSTEHAELRPGSLLLALAMEHAANEGVQNIDMLRGDETYKQIWHTERAPTCGVSLTSTAGFGLSDCGLGAVA